jgi:hypothetical protein
MAYAARPATVPRANSPSNCTSGIPLRRATPVVPPAAAPLVRTYAARARLARRRTAGADGMCRAGETASGGDAGPALRPVLRRGFLCRNPPRSIGGHALLRGGATEHREDCWVKKLDRGNFSRGRKKWTPSIHWLATPDSKPHDPSPIDRPERIRNALWAVVAQFSPNIRLRSLAVIVRLD